MLLHLYTVVISYQKVKAEKKINPTYVISKRRKYLGINFNKRGEGPTWKMRKYL